MARYASALCRRSFCTCILVASISGHVVQARGLDYGVAPKTLIAIDCCLTAVSHLSYTLFASPVMIVLLYCTWVLIIVIRPVVIRMNCVKSFGAQRCNGWEVELLYLLTLAVGILMISIETSACSFQNGWRRFESRILGRMRVFGRKSEATQGWQWFPPSVVILTLRFRFQFLAMRTS